MLGPGYVSELNAKEKIWTMEIGNTRKLSPKHKSFITYKAILGRQVWDPRMHSKHC